MPLGKTHVKLGTNFLYGGGRNIEACMKLTNSDPLVVFFEIISSHEDSDARSFMEIYCPNRDEMRVQSSGGLNTNFVKS